MASDDPAAVPEALPDHRYLSTAQVSRALGVGVTTVKRWVDDGVLPAHRTPGGHRKLMMADVVRLAREGRLPQADLTRLMPAKSQTEAGPTELLARMRAAVRAADGDAIRAVVHAGYQAGVAVETLADRVVGPALTELGHDWHAGRSSVMAEHRVTQACVAALYELRATLRGHSGPGRPVALGGAPEHDHYVLPTLFAKLTLLDAGWDAINLGPHTPFEAFEAAVRQWSPRLVWLSVSHAPDAERFLAEYAGFYQFCEGRDVAVAVGGFGLQGPLRSRMAYTAYGDGMTQLAAFARTLHRRPAPPKRGRPPASRQ